MERVRLSGISDKVELLANACRSGSVSGELVRDSLPPSVLKQAAQDEEHCEREHKPDLQNDEPHVLADAREKARPRDIAGRTDRRALICFGSFAD